MPKCPVRFRAVAPDAAEDGMISVYKAGGPHTDVPRPARSDAQFPVSRVAAQAVRQRIQEIGPQRAEAYTGVLLSVTQDSSY